MLIQELAEEFSGLNLFNAYTQYKVTYVTNLFVSRSGVDSLESINLLALARFKMETLKAVKPVTFNGYIRYLGLVHCFDHLADQKSINLSVLSR